MALLANSAPFLLTLADNKMGSLLRLNDNELTLADNNLKTIGLCSHCVTINIKKAGEYTDKLALIF